MLPGPDLADLIAYAAARGAQGDPGRRYQPAAGGGERRRHVPARRPRSATSGWPNRSGSAAAWEQHASLRLRDGDATVLADYDQHGRILGGEPEQMMDAAAAAYVALPADGTDVLLMAADHALRRELSRRIRDDLIRLGIVADDPAVRIADGAQASRRRPDHLHPQRPRRRGGRARPGPGQRGPAPHRGHHQHAGWSSAAPSDADPRTGQRRWTDRTFLYPAIGDAELGVRGHRPCRPGPRPCTPGWR